MDSILLRRYIGTALEIRMPVTRKVCPSWADPDIFCKDSAKIYLWEVLSALWNLEDGTLFFFAVMLELRLKSGCLSLGRSVLAGRTLIQSARALEI